MVAVAAWLLLAGAPTTSWNSATGRRYFQSGGRLTCRPAPFPGAGRTSLTEADAGSGIRL